MEIVKKAGAGGGCELNETELALINRLSKKKLSEQEVYTFSVRLCDNEIDRDFERFSAAALDELAGLFIGKSGVFDHQWSAKGQMARIYRTEIVREDSVITGAGDRYCYLKGYAYMLRTETNKDLIAEIEGGIKSEVSVGCAMERTTCSVCSRDMGSCGHVKGERYEERLCFATLEGAKDAYEWSFVAVPAQRKAGVMKAAKQEVEKAQMEKLQREAALGRRYLTALRDDVARLGALADPDLSTKTLKGIVEKLGEEELLALQKSYEGRAGKRYPVRVQLTYAQCEELEKKDSAFLI